MYEDRDQLRSATKMLGSGVLGSSAGAQRIEVGDLAKFLAPSSSSSVRLRCACSAPFLLS